MAFEMYTKMLAESDSEIRRLRNLVNDLTVENEALKKTQIKPDEQSKSVIALKIELTKHKETIALLMTQLEELKKK